MLIVFFVAAPCISTAQCGGVADEFLVFAQVRCWIQVLNNLANEQYT